MRRDRTVFTAKRPSAAPRAMRAASTCLRCSSFEAAWAITRVATRSFALRAYESKREHLDMRMSELASATTTRIRIDCDRSRRRQTPCSVHIRSTRPARQRKRKVSVPDTLAAVQPVLASCYAASAADVQASRRRARTAHRKAPRPLRRSPAVVAGATRDDAGPLSPPRPSRHLWSWLLRRVFAVDVRACPDCGGAMRLVTIAKTLEQVAEVLEGRPPLLRSPPAPPGQLALDFAAARSLRRRVPTCVSRPAPPAHGSAIATFGWA